MKMSKRSEIEFAQLVRMKVRVKFRGKFLERILESSTVLLKTVHFILKEYEPPKFYPCSVSSKEARGRGNICKETHRTPGGKGLNFVTGTPQNCRKHICFTKLVLALLKGSIKWHSYIGEHFGNVEINLTMHISCDSAISLLGNYSNKILIHVPKEKSSRSFTGVQLLTANNYK